MTVVQVLCAVALMTGSVVSRPNADLTKPDEVKGKDILQTGTGLAHLVEKKGQSGSDNSIHGPAFGAGFMPPVPGSSHPADFGIQRPLMPSLPPPKENDADLPQTILTPMGPMVVPSRDAMNPNDTTGQVIRGPELSLAQIQQMQQMALMAEMARRAQMSQNGIELPFSPNGPPMGQFGNMGPMGQPGQLGPKGQPGQLGPMGELGTMEQLGPMRQPGPMEELGPMEQLGPRKQPSPMGELGPMEQLGLRRQPGPMGELGPNEQLNPRRQSGPMGELGPTEQLGPMGQLSFRKRLGPMEQLGPMGHLNLRRQLGHMGELGPMGQLGPMGGLVQEAESQNVSDDNESDQSPPDSFLDLTRSRMVDGQQPDDRTFPQYPLQNGMPMTPNDTPYLGGQSPQNMGMAFPSRMMPMGTLSDLPDNSMQYPAGMTPQMSLGGVRQAAVLQPLPLGAGQMPPSSPLVATPPEPRMLETPQEDEMLDDNRMPPEPFGIPSERGMPQESAIMPKMGASFDAAAVPSAGGNPESHFLHSSPDNDMHINSVPGPFQLPVMKDIAALMTFEYSLQHVRSKLLQSFYSDLLAYRMMTQQIQQRMMVKLAMIQAVEARMAMPLRGTVAMGLSPSSYSLQQQVGI